MHRLLCALLLTSLAAAQTIVPGRFIVEMEQPAKGSRAATSSREMGAEITAQSTHVVVVRDAEETKLRQVPGVKAVYPVIEGIFLLDRALDRSGIPAAWNLAGGQTNGGRGMKIAILDSGIEATHPAFQTTDLTVPPGYPKVRAEADRPLTGNKIIVIRNYQDIQGVQVPSAIDQDGHGTSTAGTAAAVLHNTPRGQISGAAPGAQLGIYKIGPAADGNVFTSDALVMAIDDAIADGMDVISMSIGFAYSTPTGVSPITNAIERAEKAGLIVIGSAGNSGPDPNTIGAVSTTAAMLQIGAVRNDRIFASAARVEGAPAGVDFVEDEPERVEIALNRRSLPRELLGRHVGGSTGDLPLDLLARRDGKAKVRDLRAAAPVDHDVGGFQIAVEHALVVRRRKPRADLARDVESLVRRQPADAPEERGEIRN